MIEDKNNTNDIMDYFCNGFYDEIEIPLGVDEVFESILKTSMEELVSTGISCLRHRLKDGALNIENVKIEEMMINTENK